MFPLVAEPMTLRPSDTLLTFFQKKRPDFQRMIDKHTGQTLNKVIGAEAILQNVLVRLIESEGRFNDWVERNSPDQENLERMAYFWIRRAIFDVLHEEVRRLHAKGLDKQIRLPDSNSSILFAMRVFGREADPQSAAAREEVQQRVWDIIALLRREYQEVLWLRSIWELSHDDVASILEIEPATARRRHGRAMQRFAETWVARFGKEGY